MDNIKSFAKVVEINFIDSLDDEVLVPKILRPTNDGQFWHLTSDTKTISVAISNTANDIAYISKQYHKIFDNFNAREHVCEAYHMNDTTFYYVLRLIGAGKQSTVPNGTYRVEFRSDFGLVLVPFDWHADEWVDLGEQSSYLGNTIQTFFNARCQYEAIGNRHRSAAFLYGPPGNGKTTAIYKACTDLPYITLVPSADVTLSDMIHIREALKGRDIIFVFEELTGRTRDPNGVEGLLSFLDGEFSWVNTYVIATTNYPKEFPSNIIDRPGRFELLLEFPNPDTKQRAIYFKHFGIIDDELVKATAGLSLDYLRYVVTHSKINNTTPLQVLADMKESRGKVNGAFKTEKAFGL